MCLLIESMRDMVSPKAMSIASVGVRSQLFERSINVSLGQQHMQLFARCRSINAPSRIRLGGLNGSLRASNLDMTATKAWQFTRDTSGACDNMLLGWQKTTSQSMNV